MFAGGASVTARVAAQLADKPLVSSEQFSAGGNTSVRGYLQSEAVADDGLTGSLEVQTQSFASYTHGVFDDWRFYGFADAGQLWVIDAQAEQRNNFTLYSLGLGTRFALLEYLHGDLAVAMPLRTGPATQRGNPQAIFSLKAEM